MIDLEEYNSHAHVPKREYEETIKRAEEKDRPAYERALFFYDMLILQLKSKPSITEGQLSDYLVTRRPLIIKECEERFGIDPVTKQ